LDILISELDLAREERHLFHWKFKFHLHITAVAVAQPLRKMKILNFSQKIDFK
jgi:hypothetical protein